MRDWNGEGRSTAGNSLSRVNWTCEGLKPKVERNLNLIEKKCELNLWGIETNLKILIFNILKACELNLWGIETSGPPLFLGVPDQVWIEPVRDWNTYLKPLTSESLTSVNWTCEGLKLNDSSDNI